MTNEEEILEAFERRYDWNIIKLGDTSCNIWFPPFSEGYLAGKAKAEENDALRKALDDLIEQRDAYHEEVEEYAKQIEKAKRIIKSMLAVVDYEWCTCGGDRSTICIHHDAVDFITQCV